MSDETKVEGAPEAPAQATPAAEAAVDAPALNTVAAAMAGVRDLETEVGAIKKKIGGLWTAVTVLIVAVVLLLILQVAGPFLGFRLMGRAGFNGRGFQPGQGQQFQQQDGVGGTTTPKQ